MDLDFYSQAEDVSLPIWGFINSKMSWLCEVARVIDLHEYITSKSTTRPLVITAEFTSLVWFLLRCWRTFALAHSMFWFSVSWWYFGAVLKTVCSLTFWSHLCSTLGVVWKNPCPRRLQLIRRMQQMITTFWMPNSTTWWHSVQCCRCCSALASILSCILCKYCATGQPSLCCYGDLLSHIVCFLWWIKSRRVTNLKIKYEAIKPWAISQNLISFLLMCQHPSASARDGKSARHHVCLQRYGRSRQNSHGAAAILFCDHGEDHRHQLWACLFVCVLVCCCVQRPLQTFPYHSSLKDFLFLEGTELLFGSCY